MRSSMAASGVTWAGGRPEMLCTSQERGATAISRGAVHGLAGAGPWSRPKPMAK
jgi:hypothetical protein